MATGQLQDFELVLLGTGVSTGLPQIACILPSVEWDCQVCKDAHNNINSRNRRCNVCALVRVRGTGEQAVEHTVLIDCGKTIRESALRYFPQLGIGGLDAIVLTHGHADAMYGLDDVRDIQRHMKKSTPVFLSSETHKVCQKAFPYLMPRKDNKDGMQRWVSSVTWHIERAFRHFRPIENIELLFYPVPLYHGGDYICWGFVIEYESKYVAYLSDAHKIPDTSMAFLLSFPHIDILVVDCLSRKGYASHFSMDQAKEVAHILQPRITRLVGMSCGIGMHDDVNEELMKEKGEDGMEIQLGFDGEQLRVG